MATLRLLITSLCGCAAAGLSCSRPARVPAPAANPEARSVDPAAQARAAQPPSANVSAPALKNAEEQAWDMVNGMVAGDFRRVVRATYPKVVELNGGAARMEKMMADGTVQMRGDGVTFDTVVISAPVWSRLSGPRWYAILPETVTMRTPKSRLIQDSYLLAVSDDSGASWQFIDGAGLTERTMKLVLPDAPSIPLPAKQPTRQAPLLRTPAPPGNRRSSQSRASTFAPAAT